MLFVLLLGYGVWTALSAKNALSAAQANAVDLQQAVLRQDSDSARSSLQEMQQNFARARSRTDGPSWGLATHLPVIGDDVNAVRTLASIGDELSQGTVAELVSQSADPIADRIVPRRGRVDIAALEDLAPLVGRAHRNLNSAVGKLAASGSDSLTPWVEPAYAGFARKLRNLDSAMNAADRAVRILPIMLGRERPQTYLLLLDNNAEIRSTGGLPGAFAIVQTDHGRISLTRQGVPADLGSFPKPVLPQSGAEREIYFSQIARYPQDTNFTPEFPRTAELVREMWRRSQQTELDGVLSVDAVTLSYLLRATGPINAPLGVTLSSKNAAQELVNGIYFRIPNGQAQNEFFAQVAKLAFDKVASGVSSTPRLVAAFGQSVNEGRLYVHDFDASVQRVLSGSAVAGELDGGDPRVPQVGVYLNDATGSKMSYYLRTRVDLKAESCARGVQQLAGVADLTYTKSAPPSEQLNRFVTGPGTFGTPKGEQLVLVRIYGPKGGDIDRLRVAGIPTAVDAVDDRGRPVTTTAVQLRRGQTIRVSWRVRSGEGQDRAAQLTTTPGMVPTPGVRNILTKCPGA